MTIAKRPCVAASRIAASASPITGSAERLAQREHAGVAEAADDDRVGPAVGVAVGHAGVERGVRGDDIARLAGDVGGAEARRDRAHVGRRTDRSANAAREQIGDRLRRVRIDDEQLHAPLCRVRRAARAATRRSRARSPMTTSETPVVIVPSA